MEQQTAADQSRNGQTTRPTPDEAEGSKHHNNSKFTEVSKLLRRLAAMALGFQARWLCASAPEKRAGLRQSQETAENQEKTAIRQSLSRNF
jgi:hypothetical protein